MLEIFIEILKTPFLWQSLGVVTAISLFISPILYNGDYKMASKSLIIILGYALFSAMLIIYNLKNMLDCSCECWMCVIISLGLVALSYILGLFLGVYIHNKVKKN